MLIVLLLVVFTLSGGQRRYGVPSTITSYSNKVDTLRKENDKKLKLLIDTILKKQNASSYHKKNH